MTAESFTRVQGTASIQATLGNTTRLMIRHALDTIGRGDGALATFGMDNLQYLVPALPDPDFNDDTFLDGEDIDALVAVIASSANVSEFDLTGDGNVNQADLTRWLEDAGAVNLSGNAYLSGDANLDGSVDVLDFNAWNANKFTNIAAWTAGDFNADGSVNASDFDIWDAGKFQSALAGQAGAPTVPEPGSLVIALLGVLCPFFVARKW